jgi:hypothetical protein
MNSSGLDSRRGIEGQFVYAIAAEYLNYGALRHCHYGSETPQFLICWN